MSTAKGADLLVLAAHAPELVGMRTTLGTGLAGIVRSMRVVCATVGVGMPVAGAGAMRHLRDAKPRAVILLGSCGIYPQRGAHAPLDLVVPASIQLVDGMALAGKAAFPAPMQTMLEAFSVGLACAAMDLPFAAVLAVTNTVGSSGREQWAKHRRKAADHSARLLLDWIHRGAQGLPSR